MKPSCLFSVEVDTTEKYTELLCSYQKDWINDHSRVKVWEKSRRIGASWIESLYSVLQAAKKRSAGGQNTYYLSYNKDMTRQFIKDCTWWAKVLQLACGEIEEVVSDFDKDVTVFRIRFSSGWEIEALPSESRSIRSKQGRVVIDEAAFVEDLQDLRKAAIALIMWGGQIVFLSTHNGAENPFNELLVDIRSGKYQCSLHRTDIDDAISNGLYKAICRRSGQEWTQAKQDAWRADLIEEYGDHADEELFCIPSKSGGAWLTGALIESRMTPDNVVLEWSSSTGHATLKAMRSEYYGTSAGRMIPDYSSVPFVDVPVDLAEFLVERWLKDHLGPVFSALLENSRHFVGVDFGRSGDLSVFWTIEEKSDLHLTSPVSIELRDAPYRVQQQILMYLINHLPRFSGVALDARGNGSQMAEYARQELGPELAEQVMLTETWYRENMPRLKSHLEDGTLTLPKSANVKDDLRAFRVIRGIPRIPEGQTGKTGKKGQQRHADSGISLAMALFAQANMGEVEPWECETAGERMSARILQGY